MDASSWKPPDPFVSLPERLVRRAAEEPERRAYTAGEASLTFGRLGAEASALAAALVERGVRRGDRVALVLDAGLDFVRAFFAIELAGAVPCALAPTLPPAMLAGRLRRVRPMLAVVEEARGGEIAAATAETAPVVSVARLVPRSAHAPLPPPPRPSDVAHLQITSGTSGEPRAAILTHGAVVRYLESGRQVLHASREDRFVVWIPPWHDMGLFYGVVFPVAFGCESHLVAPSIATIPLWLQTLARVGGTMTAAPDFAYRIACRTVDPRGLDFSRVRSMTSGGEPVRAATIAAFERRFGVPNRIHPGYGLAEATLGVSFTLRSGPVPVHPTGVVSCGRPQPGVEVRIVNERGGPLPAGEPGEITVRGGFVFCGYLDAPEDTRAALRDGWLHTGDTGFLDAAGELYVIGRRRSLLKRAGSLVAPREIEEIADEVPGVRLSAAVEIADRIVAVVESSAQAPDEIAAAVATACRPRLGFAPDVLVVAPRSIPRSETGKLRHQELRRRIEERTIADGAIRAGAL